jgi:hypothetical protein
MAAPTNDAVYESLQTESRAVEMKVFHRRIVVEMKVKTR